ncbi:MAG TPA: radical SAM protein [Candidatus Syntrophosphaera thermopropionivorans]|nr:radical SAM protein [Candidatus Syntrophosphaera thermopropionivorans]
MLLTEGEPLIHPDFVKIHKSAPEIGIKVNLYTNVYFLSDDIVDMFKKYTPLMLDITLYGFDKESYKAFTKISDSLDNASKNLQKYSDSGIPITTRTQLHRLNYHDIDKYKLLAASFGLNFSLRSFVCSPNNNDQYHEKINLNLPPDDIVYYEKQYKDPVVESTNHL